MIVSEHIHWRDVKGEIVLFDERSQVYRTLNAVGSAIWKRAAQGMSEAEIVKSLQKSYDAPEETIATDVRGFLDDSLRDGLLIEQKAAE